MNRFLAIITSLACQACARNWVNYPPQITHDGRVIAARAAEFNGSDLIGGTTIDVTRNGVHIAAAGGINNSISTAEGYRTARYGIGATALVAGSAIVASQAASAYGANQSASAASNVAASRSAAAIAASRGATKVQLAEIAAREAAAKAAAVPAGAVVPVVSPSIPVVPAP